MRGLVTLATAFALPAQFPGCDLIVLCAFCVVLGMLVIQGLTLRPLLRLLRLQDDAQSNGKFPARGAHSIYGPREAAARGDLDREECSGEQRYYYLYLLSSGIYEPIIACLPLRGGFQNALGQISLRCRR
jgi:hypothetical protein